MQDKIFLHLFIICVIWFQEITGTVADEEIRASVNILVRQKRVLNHIPQEDLPVSNKKVPYIVKIKHTNRFICVGSILSHLVVITAALCVENEEPAQYYVVSGGARTDKGKTHTAIGIQKHYGNHPRRPADGIALLKVDQPFVYGTFTNFIELHSGPLLAGTLATISGWGYNVGSGVSGTCNSKSLRSIVISIMAHRDCVNRYQPQIQISDMDICTYHPQKHCGHTDGGAPLVVDGYLAGVYLWSGPGRLQNNPEYPDVFALLQHSAYNQWIRSNI